MRYNEKRLLRKIMRNLKLVTFKKSWDVISRFKRCRALVCFKRLKLDASRAIRALHVKK